MFKYQINFSVQLLKISKLIWIYGVCVLFYCNSSSAFAQSIDSAFIKMNYSYQYEAAGNFAQAINAIINTEFPEEFNYQKLMRLGWLNYQSYNSAVAITYYKQAEKLEPNSMEAKEALLKNYFVLQEFKDAERIARKIMKVSPENYPAHYYLAELALLNLNYIEAEYQLKKISRLFPTDYSANILLLQCYNSMNNKKKAMEVEDLLNRLYPERNGKK